MRTTQTPHTGRFAGKLSPYLLWIIWLFWLFFLAQPASMALALPFSPQKLLILIGMALFIGLYLWITWHEAWRLTRETPTPADHGWRNWTAVGALLALSVMMTLLQGPSALGSLIYVSAALGGQLTAWRAAAAVVGLTLLTVLLGALSGAPLSASGQIFFIVPAVGSIVYFFSQAVRTNQELRRARQEIARLAVSEERLRFARDLHDLLGHTLSLIALKSELARRLLSAAPEQAAAEISAIEMAARQALVEGREAVAAYRHPTLENELTGARELRSAAGITFTQQGAPPPLASAAEAALSWAVREGVTNVIRHSHARSCAILLSSANGQVRLEVSDDGAAPADQPATPGSGLAGLRERVAALGGSCVAGGAPGGGWRLAITLPAGADSVAASAHAPQGEERQATAWFG